MYRGRYRHEPQRDTALTRVASTLMRHPVMGPRELFYADIFASRRTGCRSALGMPGVRDRHSGLRRRPTSSSTTCSTSCCCRCPTTTGTPTRRGSRRSCRRSPRPTCSSRASRTPPGGVDEFLAEHAMIVMADHSQAPVTAAIALQDELAELGVLGPARPTRSCPRPARAESVEPRIAVCPSQRAAMVYALHEDERDAMRASVVAMSMALEGVDLVMWLERDAHDRPREGVIASPVARRAALRAGRAADRRPRPRLEPRGRARRARRLRARDGVFVTPDYPDALAARLVGAAVPDLGRGAALGGARLRVPRLGPPGARRRRQPRLAARQRLARRARAARRRSCPIRRPRSGRYATSPALARAHFGVA